MSKEKTAACTLRVMGVLVGSLLQQLIRANGFKVDYHSHCRQCYHSRLSFRTRAVFIHTIMHIHVLLASCTVMFEYTVD